MTPYYDEDGITIYHGNLLDIISAVTPDVIQKVSGPGSSCQEAVRGTGSLGSTPGPEFDIGFADPPYNYGMDYGPGFNDKRPTSEYEEWCGAWFELLRARAHRVFVTPGYGNLAQWLARSPSGIAAWYKPGNPSGAGIFQFCEWEPVCVWGSGRIGGSDVWRATINPTFGRLAPHEEHPCPKPVKLLTLILMAAKGQSVLDPFVGSGTTLVAAKALGMRAVGIERNERYCEIAVQRLAQGVLDFSSRSTPT